MIQIDGSGLKQLTIEAVSSTTPRWSPEGKRIAFVTGGQVWTMEDDGDNKDQVTKISTSAAAPVWSPDGNWIAFTSEVHPDCSDDDCNKKKDEAAENSKVKAHITTRLLFRIGTVARHQTNSVRLPSKGVRRETDTRRLDFRLMQSLGRDFASRPTRRTRLRSQSRQVEAFPEQRHLVLPLSGGAQKHTGAIGL